MSISHYILESSLISHVEQGGHIIYIYVHHIIQPLLVSNALKIVLYQ